MGRYILKRVSYSKIYHPKKYTLKRKTFGLGDVLNKGVGTIENVAGGAMTGVGQATDSFIGKNVVGTTLGALGGMALLPKLGMALGGPLGGLAGGLLAPTVGLVGGALAGRGIMSTAGKTLKGVGESLKDDAASRM